MNTREALPAPAPREVFCRQHLVFIRHPGRDEPLFRFPALSTGCTSAPYGVFRPLVLDACRVLTNRAANIQEDEDGDFLASDIQGRNRIEVDDTPLDVDCYYFLGPPEVEANRNYPIVKTLSAFTFPSVLPDRWAKIADALGQQYYPPLTCRHSTPSEMSTIVGMRDEHRCAITRWLDCMLFYLIVIHISLIPCIADTAAQCVHLIPKSEEAWFIAHHLAAHISEDMCASVDHPSNGILLRADVRLCFDAHGFVFYPSSDSKFVAYFVRCEYTSLPDLFHRRPATIHADIPVHLLYARFAYAIINHPRQNRLFESVPESEKVASIREEMALEEKERAEELDRSGGGDEEEEESDSRACAYAHASGHFHPIYAC